MANAVVRVQVPLSASFTGVGAYALTPIFYCISAASRRFFLPCRSGTKSLPKVENYNIVAIFVANFFA